MGEGFRCSVAAAVEPLAGTAAVDSAFLLIEYSGPWGRKAFEESRLPEEVRATVTDRAARAGVRLQLVRRHRRQSTGLRVFLVYAGAEGPWVETKVLSSPEELLELDLDGLAAGVRPGFEPHEDPLLLACTNGRRDTCCAEKGRPLVAALDAAYPELTWETTHVGGHRFAGAMLVLPHGLAYGRVLPDDAVRIGKLALQGRLELELLRGRAAYPGPVQAAEIALLQRLGRDEVDTLRLVSSESDGDRTTVTFESAEGSHVVEVDTVTGDLVRQSCGDDKVKPSVVHVAR